MPMADDLTPRACAVHCRRCRPLASAPICRAPVGWRAAVSTPTTPQARGHDPAAADQIDPDRRRRRRSSAMARDPATPLLSVDGPPRGVRRVAAGSSGRSAACRTRSARRDDRPGGRVGLRARASARCRCSGCCRSGSGGSRPGARCFEGQEHPPPARGAAAQDPRRQDRDDLPGPAVQPQPGPDDRPPDHRGARDAPRRQRASRPRSGRSSCSSWSASRARTRASTTTRTSSAAACASAR